MTNLRRRLLPVLLLVLAAFTVVRADEEPDNRFVDWLSYNEALATGQGRQVPILLHFMAGWSDAHRRMMREIYTDPKVVRYLNENFAVAQVDIERLPSLAKKFKVESVPTVWFLDADGRPLTAVNGEVGPEKMLRITEYVNKKIYLHTDYQTWLDKRRGR